MAGVTKREAVAERARNSPNPAWHVLLGGTIVDRRSFGQYQSLLATGWEKLCLLCLV